MRSGGYTLHQSLTTEAASVVKQSVNLARRRGHAQVTPLHVAISMLSSPAALLKRACLKSHSHPLQCKALELCFNVALNRLATSASIPLVGPHPHLPSLSNALVAAFKRAQAHQRRGSIENQQQPVLALKVEIEQLVISILDDPSVSRVMREAGFSSTQVKNNVEQSIISTTTATKVPSSAVLGKSSSTNVHVMSVLEAMMNKKTRNTIIVCESKTSGEGLVREVIEKFDKKDVPSDMKFVQFISVPLFTLRNISKEEFEVKIAELRSLVRSYVDRGVVLYLGDLDRVSEFWSDYNNGEKRGVYNCPMEYMIMEISRLICGAEENKRVWLMGIATFKIYAKCKIGSPSLETLWSLYPLTLPVSTLGLGLSLDSGMHDEVKTETAAYDDDLNLLYQNDQIKNQLVCCSDCSANFTREARDEQKYYFINGSSCSTLPSWLQQYKDHETRSKQVNSNQKECDDKIKELCKKWNSICSSIHTRPHFLRKVFDLSPSSSPSSSTSNGHKNLKFHQKLVDWPVIFERNQAPNEHQISKHENEGEVSKPDLLSNPNSSPNSASSSEASGDDRVIMELFPRKFDSDSHHGILCSALEKKVPWQKCIIPDIVSTILKCRSGIKTTNKGSISNIPTEIFRQESWMLFLGSDNDGKEAIARELATTVFGSRDDDNFVAIGISSFSSSAARGDSSTDQEVMSKSSSVTNKRARDENGGSVYDRFLEAVRFNPSRVFYVEDADELDYRCLKGFKKMMRDGSVVVSDHDGEDVLMKDAIVVLSCEKYDFSCDREEDEDDHQENGDDDDDQLKKEKKQRGSLDLNIATEDHEIGMLDLVDIQVVFKIQVL